jgi:hypothetical protein
VLQIFFCSRQSAIPSIFDDDSSRLMGKEKIDNCI